MNIVEVIYNWPPEVFLKRHIIDLKSKNENLKVLALNEKESFKKRAVVQDVPRNIPVSVKPKFNCVSYFRKIYNLRHLMGHLDFLKMGIPIRDRVLLSFFRNLKADLFHFHGSPHAVSLGWIPIELGIPYTLSLRGSDVQLLSLKSSNYKRAFREALIQSAGVHSVCEDLGNRANEYLNINLPLRTIYTTVPIPNELPSYDPPTKEPIKFVSVGQIMWRKAYTNLLLALRKLNDQGFTSQLTIIGNGTDEDRLTWWIEKLNLESHVKLVGKKTTHEVTEILSRSHAYIQSSVCEGLSNALAEAMANGCPIFATDIGGTREVIEDGKNGFLLSPMEPEKWPEKLYLAKNRALMSAIRSAAYQTARALFSSEVHTAKFIEFYRDAVAQKQTWRATEIIESDTIRNSIKQQDLPSVSGKILVLGQWHWKNGTDQLLWVVRELLKENNDFYWIFCGSGPQEIEIRYLAKLMKLEDNIRILYSKHKADDNELISPLELREWADIIIETGEEAPNEWSLYTQEKVERIPVANTDKLISRIREHRVS